MNETRKMLGLIALALALLAAACGGSDDSETSAPEIIEGRTMCDECGMIIDEIRFAASYRTADGEERRFDDIGGMLAQGHRDGRLGDSDIWVHDYKYYEAVPAQDATYVLSGDVVTPMAWGLVAFESADDARELASEVEGTIVDWEELVELSAGDDLEPGQLHRDHGTDETSDHEMSDKDMSDEMSEDDMDEMSEDMTDDEAMNSDQGEGP